MASWKKVLTAGVDLTGADVTGNDKDLVIGAGLSLDGTAATSSTTQASNDVLLGADGDVTIAIDIAGQTDLGSSVASGDLLLVADITDSNNIKRTSVADIVGAVSTGVTSITSGNGLTSNSSATGSVTINLDTSTLGTETVTGTTEFIVSNSDTEGVAAASAIPLTAFDNTASAFIDLTDLSVTVASAGSANLSYNDTSGVFTYTPPDLSSYQLSADDKFASAFSYTGGTTSGPTGTLTVTNGSNVSFGAIPSASATASGIVTTGSQNLAGDKTFDDNVIITGNLTVNGDTTTVSTTNMTVEDRFISLNSGGASDVTTGIVFEGAADKVFGWDTSSGRFAMDLAGGDASAAGGGFSPDGYMVAAHSGAGTPAGVDDLAIAGLEKIGNIYVDTSDNDAIYIYS